MVPAAGCVAAALARGDALPGGRRALAAGALGSALAGIALAPLALHLPPTLGVFAVAATALLVALGAGPAAAAAQEAGGPGRLAPGLALLAAALALAVIQATRPQATADAPEKLTFTFHESPEGARWLAEAERDGLPPAVRAAASFSARRTPPFPWSPARPAFSAPAPRLGLPPPRAEVLSVDVRGGVRQVRVRLSSPRGAPVVALFLPPTPRILAASVEGHALAPPPRLALWFWGGHRLVASMTTPPEGVTVVLAFASEAPVEAALVDRSPGLPPAGAALVAARPETAAPFWDGDATVATARASF